MSASNFLYKGVPLSQILHAGAVAASGYNTGSLGTTNIDFKTTSKANNKPLTIPYLYQSGALISNTYAAKHVQYTNLSDTTITKPLGSNALRFIITGASGGGGGGSGGAWQGASENHATRGFDGNVGGDGGILYSTSDISLTNVNTVRYWIGSAGAAGNGNAGIVGGNSNTDVVQTVVGGTGGTGNATSLTVNATFPQFSAVGGIGGAGGSIQYANSADGWSESFYGAENATQNNVGSNTDAAYGNWNHGQVTGIRTDGNTDPTPNTTATATAVLNTNWDNNIYTFAAYKGNGGAPGWGYSLTENTGGANSGIDGNAGGPRMGILSN
jgi:hypothetical protein